MKYKKAKKKLDIRIKAYENDVKNDRDNGQGLHKPGSLSGKK